jgi:hypothetical protein
MQMFFAKILHKNLGLSIPLNIEYLVAGKQF